MGKRQILPVRIAPLLLLGASGLLAGCGDDGNSGSSAETPSVSLVGKPSIVVARTPATLTWSSTGVTSCTASGGNASDGWAGAETTSGTQDVTESVAGTYNYVLTCSGSGNVSVTATTTVMVVAAQTTVAPVFATALTASPTSVAPGGTVMLSWAVRPVAGTTCVASGGDGGASWNGIEPTAPSAPVAVTTSANPGTYSYVLTCVNDAGSVSQNVSVTVGSPTAAAPSFVTPLTSSSDSVIPGGSFTLNWSVTPADSVCTASGGDNGSSWSGPEPAAPTAPVSIKASSVAGSYAYVLTCSGSGGSTSQSVTITVAGVDCGIPDLPTTALLAPNASIGTAASPLCLLCTVSDPFNVIDADRLNSATINVPVGILATESIRVTNSAAFPGGRVVGFLIADPTELLTLSLLQSVTVSTYLNGKIQETAAATSSSPLQLDLLNLLNIGNLSPAYLSFKTNAPFDAVQLDDGNAVSALSALKVFGACASNE